MERGVDRGRGLGEPFFLIQARTSNSPSSFRTSISIPSFEFEEDTHPAQQPIPLNNLESVLFWLFWTHMIDIWTRTSKREVAPPDIYSYLAGSSPPPPPLPPPPPNAPAIT